MATSIEKHNNILYGFLSFLKDMLKVNNASQFAGVRVAHLVTIYKTMKLYEKKVIKYSYIILIKASNYSFRTSGCVTYRIQELLGVNYDN